MLNAAISGLGSAVRQAGVQGSAQEVQGRAPAADVANEQRQDVDVNSLRSAVGKLNDLVSPDLQSVQFMLDEESDRVIVKVVDSQTQQVLRQIPNEEVLAFSKALGKLQGVVVRERA